ncbi:MAG: hypothetical protein ABEI77_08945 [Halorientalis sp.]
MRNQTAVDPEDDHYYITGATIEGEETTRKNGIVFVQDRPVAFSSVADE